MGAEMLSNGILLENLSPCSSSSFTVNYLKMTQCLLMLQNELFLVSLPPDLRVRTRYQTVFTFLFPDAGGMKEQDLMCIKLHGVNRIGLKKIIDFIYTAKLSLNMENLQDTLEAASFLQILPVLDFCKVFLISGVSEHIDTTVVYRASP